MSNLLLHKNVVLRWIKNGFIYYFARCAVAVVGFVPNYLGPAIGSLLGMLAYLIAKKERGLAKRHLSLAFRSSALDSQINRLVRGVFCELGRNAVELCRLFRSKKESPTVEVPHSSKHALDSALKEGKGVIFVTGHLGNWELMALKLAALGYPISTVAKESYDSRFTSLIERFRSGFGIQAIYRGKPGAPAAMLRALKRNRVLGFLIDQDTSVPSTFVPFFGHPAHTPIGAAVFALRTGAPVVIGSIHRVQSGNHIVDISRLSIPQNVEQATAIMTEHLEARIRRHPTQWVWFHRRWKTQPSKRVA